MAIENWTDVVGWSVGKEAQADTFHVYRSTWVANTERVVEVKVFSTCPFHLYVDEEWFGEGPLRWTDKAPEYQVFRVKLSQGAHVLSFVAHYEGVETRLIHNQAGYLACTLIQDGQTIPLVWKGTELKGYHSQARRINPELGWIEWCDTRERLEGWKKASFDDKEWLSLDLLGWKGKAPRAASIALATPKPTGVLPIGHGIFTERYGYDSDDSPVQFFLRDLEAHHGKPQGVWRRYDLGRVRLGRWSLDLDVPAGSVVTVASSESLIDGRVCPWITLSVGNSANLDRYVARGGHQTLMPHTPKGGRFVEVHVSADPKAVHFASERVYERTYHHQIEGSLESSDHRLNAIWMTGVHTFQACSEDSVIDNPTRERGQWIGDTLSVGLANAAAAFSDLGLLRKALFQAAECARADGLVAGLCPGTVGFLSTYACHWVKAAVRYWELTGDRQLLVDLYPFAVANMNCFSKALTEHGLVGDLGWAFIDWGYVGNEGPSDMGLNLIYLEAVRSMVRWAEALGSSSNAYRIDEEIVTQAIQKFLNQHLAQPEQVGLQQRVFALASHLIPANYQAKWVSSIVDHYRKCFPNDPMAPNLADPSTAQARLITPFFSHFALPVLWESGEGEFVLNQYRTCWGWALDQGLTTWPEVFDLRWSHCHQWSGCPTWQLSRYLLGINLRQDIGPRVLEFKPIGTHLESVNGHVPVPSGGAGLDVHVQRIGSRNRWTIRSKEAFVVLSAGKEARTEYVWEG